MTLRGLVYLPNRLGKVYLGTQRKEGLGSRLSGKAASTEIQQEQQADPMCNQLKQQRKLCQLEKPSGNPDKAFATGKTGSTLEGLEI